MLKMENSDAANSTPFYNPLSKYNYLTPEQRKKKREILERKGILISKTKEVTPVKSQKTITKRKKCKGSDKSKFKIGKRKLFCQEGLKQILTETPILETTQNHQDFNSEDKKFFKNRSPGHLKKVTKTETSYVSSFIKKSRLDFSKCKHNSFELAHSSMNLSSHISEALSQKSNIELNVTNNSGSLNNLTENKVENKHCFNKEFVNSENSIKGLNVINKLLFEIQESFNDDTNELKSLGSAKEKSQTFASGQEFSSSENCRALLSSGTNNIINSCDSKLTNESVSNNKTTSPKFYPLFYKSKERKTDSMILKSVDNKSSFKTKDNSKGCEQLIIDAGQKEFGTKQCKTCYMIYAIGHAEDEKLHAKYHDKYLVNLKFPGWKEERIIRNYHDGRVIKVLEDDKNYKLKKIQDILCIINKDLGFSSTEFPVRPNINFLLFISNDKKVKGCLVAESITSASPVILGENSFEKEEFKDKVIWKLGSWYASSETVPAICGVNRIWVSKEYRRHKVASRLIDCLRESFIFGYVISHQEIAFTDPTPDGREFAAHYTGTDNFLVYK